MSDLRLFINRKHESEFLKRDIQATRTKSRLLLVSAYTGIGKSALIDEVFPEFTNFFQYRVRVSIDKKSEIQEGYILKQIAKLVHQNALAHKLYPTIYHFIQHDRFYKNVANGVVKAIMGYIKLEDFAEGFKKKNEEVSDNIKTWLGDDDELLDICYRYVLSVAQAHRLFLAIENFQIADSTSIHLLLNLLTNVTNIYLVGECTISGDDDKISDYLQLFGEENIDVNNLRLEKLDKEELLNSIKDEKELLISIIERTYENSDGNLHKFKLLRNPNNLRKYDVVVPNYNNITQYLLNNLDDIGLALVTIIHSHQGEVSLNLLEVYLQYSLSFDFVYKSSYLNKLSDLQHIGLIKILTDRVIIEHDSVSIDLNNIEKLKKVQLIAIRNWIRVYQYLERTNTKYEIDYIDNLLYQVYFYLKLDALSELPEVLEKLNQYIAVSPTYNIIFQLDRIAEYCRKYASEDDNSEVFKWMIIMYYRCGHSDKVINMASPMLLTDTTILLCYLAALSTFSQSEVFEFINELEKDKSGAQWLGLILVKIRALRSDDNFNDCKKLWLEHYARGSFQNTSFNAGFLKYCTLVEHDDYIFRIKCLSEAMELFQNLNDRFGQISTCIALSRDSAYVGDLKNCRHYLEKAETLANMSVYPRYELYNNRSVLDIITENVNQITKDSLNNSLRICSNNGDRLIILSNILVISIMEKDTVYGYSIYTKLQKEILSDFDKKDTITHLCLYNCYRYSLLIGEAEQSKYLLGFLHKLEIRQDIELWNYLIYEKGLNPYQSVIKKEYYPTFMLGWDIDYYTALSNY